jgi:cytoskeleton-associated protein 5
MPMLATLIGDKDAAARSAALQLISTIYGLEGETISPYFKKLSVKDQGLLNERLKRTPSASAPPVARLPITPTTNGRVQEKTVPAPVVTKPLAGALSTKPPPRSVIPDDRLTAIGNTNEAISVEALKLIQRDIATKASSLVSIADALVVAIVGQMRYAFADLNSATSPSTLRLCKHLMQTLSGFFDDVQLSKAASQDALVELLAELARRLLETADNSKNEAISSLSKVLNMVLIRIFHNASKNACFGSAFNFSFYKVILQLPTGHSLSSWRT